MRSWISGALIAAAVGWTAWCAYVGLPVMSELDRAASYDAFAAEMQIGAWGALLYLWGVPFAVLLSLAAVIRPPVIIEREPEPTYRQRLEPRL